MLHTALPDAWILALSPVNDPGMIIDAVRAGAREFLVKPVHPESEAAAIMWLKSASDGVVAEAVGGSYSDYGRVSVYTGLPAVLGWPGHEVQWRGTADPQGSRQDDIKILYEAPNWDSAGPILDRYDIRYVYVGALERSTYAVDEQKLADNLSLVFQQGEVHIYEVP